jgi:hypothetical protein
LHNVCLDYYFNKDNHRKLNWNLKKTLTKLICLK